MKIAFTIVIIATLLSCQKEGIIMEENPSAAYDASLEVYFGTWEFTHNTTVYGWATEFDSLGQIHYVPSTTYSSHQTTGIISMGRTLGELRIAFDSTMPSYYIHAKKVNTQGQLTCTENCTNVGYHDITDSTYQRDVSTNSSGGSYPTVTSYTMTGIKL